MIADNPVSICGSVFLYDAALWLGVALCVIFLFGLSVFVHELGHFIAAKIFGLRVDTFSIGFGPAVWKRKYGGTEYKIAWFPLGGYVALPQLDPDAMKSVQGAADENMPPAAWWKRITVAVAGPLGNVLFAILLAFAVWALPSPEPDTMPEEVKFRGGVVVGYVEKDSAAEKGGLEIGDMITAVKGKPVNVTADVITETHLSSTDGFTVFTVSNILNGAVRELTFPVEKDPGTGYLKVGGWTDSGVVVIDDFVEGSPAAKSGLKKHDVIVSVCGVVPVSVFHAVNLVSEHLGGEIEIGFARGKKRGKIKILPEELFDGKERRPMIGVAFGTLSAFVPQWMAFKNPKDQIYSDFKSISRLLRSLFFPKQKGESKRVFSALGGPIQIFYGLWIWIMSSFVSALGFTRFLNINLAVMNLLPIPFLDGGHVVFALWRGIFRRELPSKIVDTLVNVFALLFLVFFIYISGRDVNTIYRLRSHLNASAETANSTENKP